MRVMSATLIRESFRAEAEGRLQDALSIAAKLPQDSFAVFRQGKLLFKMGQLGQALGAFNAVVSAEPVLPIAVVYKAYVHYRLGELKSCSIAAAQALNITLTDNRAATVLRLCSESKRNSKHQRLLALHDLASREVHARGGYDLKTGRNHSQPLGNTSRAYARSSRGLVLVSSANSLYFDCLSNLVGSVQLREPAMRIAIYDLGLDDLERAVAAAWRNAEVTPFPFDRHPPHVRNLRNYAWKPLVYEHALARFDMLLYQATTPVPSTSHSRPMRHLSPPAHVLYHAIIPMVAWYWGVAGHRYEGVWQQLCCTC
jgi:tetratricopeptide (TPR) repeat protein